MKIGLVVPGFSANEKDWCIPALLDLVRTLARENSIHVFALEYPYRRDNYPVYGATVHSLNGGNRGKAYAPRLWAATFAAIRTEHLRGPFDVLQAFWVNEPGVIGLLAARAYKIPFVASVAGGELAALRDINYGGQLHFIERMMTRAVIQNAKRVTAGSRYLKDIALRHRSKIEVLPLGVDTILFSPDQQTQSRPFKLLNVASLVPVKGHTTLLDAMAKLESYEACLEIVGSGELEAELTAHAKNLGISSRVRFSGSIPHHLMPDKYRWADLFVQSSYHEAQGMAVLEAAACGIASAGTRVGILPELAREGAASISSGTRADNLAAAIVDAREARERMGRRAREIATLEYDLETTCSKWTRLYQEMQGLRQQA